MSVLEVSCKTCWFDFTVWDEQEVRITRCPNCGSRIILDAGRFRSVESLLYSVPALSGTRRVPGGDVDAHRYS